MINLIIFLVVGYIMYRLLITRIRWRAVRVLLYLPILVVVVLAIGAGSAISTAMDETPAQEIAAQVVDEQVVSRGDLIVSVNGTGAIQPMRQVPLTFASIGQVSAVYVAAGERVQAGDVIAELDTSDFAAILDNAAIALSVQESAYAALTDPAREVDIAAAQAALVAARAQYYAAASTSPSSQQDEIARLQFELAKNQNYQLNLQRDAVTVPDLGSFNVDIAAIPQIDGSTLPDEVQDAVNAVNQQIDTFNGDLNSSVNELANAALSGQAQQAIAAADAQREQLNSNLDEAATNASIAEQQYLATVNRGPDAGAVGAANAAIAQAQIAVDRLVNGADEQDLQMADINVKLAQNALAQAQQSVLNAQLIAPFEGVIATNNLTVGELPPQGVAILLMDSSGYVLDVPIDETDIVTVAVGQRVELSVDALPDTVIMGVVQRVAYTPVRIGQLVTYTVHITVDATDAALRPAMSATVRIITQERPDVLLLRNRFVRIDPITQQALVTVRDADGNIAERAILLGERNDIESEILAGLQAGDTVVLLPRGTEGVDGIFG